MLGFRTPFSSRKGVWGGDRCPSLQGTVEVLQQVGKDPLCYYVEIYRAYNPQMNVNTF